MGRYVSSDGAEAELRRRLISDAEGDTSQADISQVDNSQVDNSQVNNSQANNSQADSSQADNLQAGSSQADNSEADNLQAGSSQADNSQADSSQADSTPVDNSQPFGWESHQGTDRKLIGYRGNLYDVTNFTKVHPGGDVIERFVGHDATCVIDAMHRFNVMKNRKPVGTYPFVINDFERDMNEIELNLQKNGDYDSSLHYYVKKCTLLILLFIGLLYSSVTGAVDQSTFTRVASGLFLALLWQQCGMLMHDAMHTQITRNRATDEKIGLFFGTFLFGISARWWKDEHVLHHALVNTLDYATGWVDPQADEVTWAQNIKLLPLHASKLKAIAVQIQTWTFLPLTVMFGRIAIIIDGMSSERRKDVWVAWLLHLSWISLFLSSFSSWSSVVFAYAMGCLGEGVLHIQLLINHYTKEFYELPDRKPGDHYRMMIECNTNITCPEWMDWFHGGLNFHHEHHCFPRLPRDKLRHVAALVRRACRKHHVVYDECGFFVALYRTLRQLHDVQTIFAADIRN